MCGFDCCLANLFDFLQKSEKNKIKIYLILEKSEEISEIKKIGMAIEICIEILNWLMLEV